MRSIQSESGCSLRVEPHSLVVRLQVEDVNPCDGFVTRASMPLSWENAVTLWRQLGEVLRDQRAREGRTGPTYQPVTEALRIKPPVYPPRR
jgi:hypothetical protein